MTIVDRSSEKSDLESVGCKRSPFPSGDAGMDGSCSSWGGGPSPSDPPRVKAGGCLGPTPGATVYSNTSHSGDRPKDQGKGLWVTLTGYVLTLLLNMTPL